MAEKLRFAVRKFDPFEQALKKIWQTYRETSGTGLEMEFVPMDLEELYFHLFTRDGLMDGSWDIVHINTDWIAQAYARGGLAALNLYLESRPPEAYGTAWCESLSGLQNFDGKIVGLPFHDGPECLIFRKDLFEHPVYREAFVRRYGSTLEIPVTWDDFLRVADFFTRPEEGLYGTVFAGYPDGHNAVFDFCVQLWSRGGRLVDDSHRVLINQPVAEEALDFYRDLFRTRVCLHPQSHSLESIGAGQTFARGEVAMMINWFGFAAWAQVDTRSSVRGNVDVAPIPVHKGLSPLSLNVYWLYGIAQGSVQKQHAYEFIRHAVSPENDKLLTLEGGIGCRLSTWKDADVNRHIPFFGKLPLLHQQARTLPRLATWPAIAHIIDKTVAAAIQTDIPSGRLLADAQHTINLCYDTYSL
ncbi:multiple sugar transport system substrate-binding protein [Parapedobacter composti]|uniref:Multiple sugar transport system substrate-binding protein n=1 Tax=Parapedobacter composti TaxID=623281 RepID=A0A1I1GT89_9SPHI|nr:extracellular solute-binding protein [Parapedobacter composti]SFC14716.1 multiple sugar transport system substrate-binding protein [Parapedobacter composti]